MAQKQPSSGMLTAGAVGAFLNAGMYAIILVSFFSALALVGSDSDPFDIGRIFGGFALLGGLAYLGGLPCMAVGLNGMKRLYSGTYGVAATLTWVHFGLIIALLTLGPTMAPEMMEMRDSGALIAFSWAWYILVAAMHLFYGISFLKGSDGSGIARVAAWCFIIAAIMTAVLALLTLTGIGGMFDSVDDVETGATVAMWIFIVFFGLLTLGHLAAGLAMLRSKPAAAAANAF